MRPMKDHRDPLGSVLAFLEAYPPQALLTLGMMAQIHQNMGAASALNHIGIAIMVLSRFVDSGLLEALCRKLLPHSPQFRYGQVLSGPLLLRN